jgi:hypothetical protein
MTTANDRLVELKKDREARLYDEAKESAGFEFADDYDAWLVLEELRKLTLAERKAIADKENPPKTNGNISISSGHLTFPAWDPSHIANRVKFTLRDGYFNG